MNDWFIQKNGKTFGPISDKQLKALASSSKINGETRIKKGVDGQWSTARKVKGLFPLECLAIGIGESAIEPRLPVAPRSALPVQPSTSDRSIFSHKSLLGVMAFLVISMACVIVWLVLRTQPDKPSNLATHDNAALPTVISDTNKQSAAVSLDDANFNSLLEKRRELKQRLENEIPALRNKIALQAEDVKKLLATASTADKERLSNELNEIARADLAAEAHEKDVRELLSQLDSGARQLDRLREFAKSDPNSDEKLRVELEKMALDIGTRLSVPLDLRIGSGPIEDLELKARLDAIVNRKEAPQYVVIVPENSTSIQAYTAPPQGSTLGQIEKLLETAKTNDNAHSGKIALAALEKILQLNPTNAEARTLRLKIMRYYGPIVLVVPLDYATIQQAIDAAQSGDAVQVKPGRYKEAILLKDGVTIAGEDMATCRLEPASGYPCVIDATGVKSGAIRNLTIDGQQTRLSEIISYGIGFELQQSMIVVTSIEPGAPAVAAGLKVGDVIVSVDGQTLANAAQLSAILTHRKIHAPEQPVLMEIKSGNTQKIYKVKAGRIKTQGSPAGVIADYSGGVEFEKCMFVALGTGLALNECAIESKIANCEFHANGRGVSSNMSPVTIVDTTFVENERSAVYLGSEGSIASIRNSSFVNNGCGVAAEGGATCTLLENDVLADNLLDSPRCIIIRGKRTTARLEKNTLKGGLTCVEISDGASAELEENLISNASFIGIEIEGNGTHATLKNNTIHDDRKDTMAWCVQVSDGASADLEGNSIGPSEIIGVGIEGAGTNATLDKNTIHDDRKKPEMQSCVDVSEGAKAIVKNNVMRGADEAVNVEGDDSEAEVRDNDFTLTRRGVEWLGNLSRLRVSISNKGLMAAETLTANPVTLRQGESFQVAGCKFDVSSVSPHETETNKMRATFLCKDQAAESIEKLTFVDTMGYLLTPEFTGSVSYGDRGGPVTYSFSYIMNRGSLTVRIGCVMRNER
jgi:hypothetical protein